jgi:CIC family chloride channel protein
LTQLPWFLLLGVAAGTGGALFQKALRGAEHCFARVPLPLYGRIALAGLGVGLLALVYPEVLGNGYEATNRLIRTAPVLEFAAGLLVAKFLATTLMVGSGTPGGVFTPTLFLGAALGGLFEAFLKLAGAGDALPTGCFTLAGMAAMLAATTHSPLLAMIMSFELTLNYSLMPAVMVACVVATLMSRRLHPESIYTEPLRRKGLELDRETTRPGAATERSVADLMRAPIEPLLENTPFRTIADRFLVSPNNFLPVVDGDARLLGVVALHDLKEWLNAAQDFNGIIASDVMRPPPACLTPNQRLLDALPVLLASEMRNVPVVNNLQQFRLIGSLARAEALNLVSDAITARAAARV